MVLEVGMALSNYLANELLDHTLRNLAYTPPTTVYLALFTVMPDVNGAGGTEVTGGSYARQAVTFGAASGGIAASTAAITFSSMPAAVVVGAALYDALTVGNMLHFGPWGSYSTITAATDFVVAVADVVAVMR